MEAFVIRQEDIITDSQNDDIIGDIWGNGSIDPEIFT